MQVLELLSVASLLFFFFLFLLVPFGYSAACRLWPDLGRELTFLTSFGLSSLFYAVLVSLFVIVNLPGELIGIALIVACFVSLWIWTAKGHHRELFCSSHNVGIALIFLFYLLAVTWSAFPDGAIRNVQVDTTMHLTGLPVDNLIPYNMARYFVERLDMQQLEVVPGWRASDRGPLAGILYAAVSFMLDLEEKGPWLTTSTELYFVFSAFLIFLNLLAALAVWFIAEQFLGRRSAVCALMFLFSLQFFLRNVMFTWPKFYMAYFVLTALVLWLYKRQWTLAGVFFGAAILAHDSGVFYLVSFVSIATIYQLWMRLFNRERAERFGLMPFVLACVLVLLPWTAFKAIHAPASERLLSMHLFCIDQPGVKIDEAYSRYEQSHSVEQMLNARVENLVYPFNMERLIRLWPRFYQEPYLFLFAMRDTFYLQLSYTLGLPALLLVLYSLIRAARDASIRKLHALVVFSLGALAVAAISFGCAPATGNYHWAFPALLCVSLIIGRVAATGGVITGAVFLLALAFNLLVTVALSYFIPDNFVQGHIEVANIFAHATPNYTASLLTIAALIFVVMIWELGLRARRI